MGHTVYALIYTKIALGLNAGNCYTDTEWKMKLKSALFSVSYQLFALEAVN